MEKKIKENPLSSPLKDFEFAFLRKIFMEKVIPVGSYYVVGVVADKKLSDYRAGKSNLFVQGYRPHSGDGPFACAVRRYGQIYVGCDPKDISPRYEDDIFMAEANLYRATGENSQELVLLNGEQRCKTEISRLFSSILAEKQILPMSEIALYEYECHKSQGYYLAGRTYKVWSQLVNVENRRRVICSDYYCGVPDIVEYDKNYFRRINE